MDHPDHKLFATVKLSILRMFLEFGQGPLGAQTL